MHASFVYYDVNWLIHNLFEIKRCVNNIFTAVIIKKYFEIFCWNPTVMAVIFVDLLPISVDNEDWRAPTQAVVTLSCWNRSSSESCKIPVLSTRPPLTKWLKKEAATIILDQPDSTVSRSSRRAWNDKDTVVICWSQLRTAKSRSKPRWPQASHSCGTLEIRISIIYIYLQKQSSTHLL